MGGGVGCSGGGAVMGVQQWGGGVFNFDVFFF